MHSWFKLRLHTYICKKCGMGKVNIQRGIGYVQEWHFPDTQSTILVLPSTPTCKPHERTAERVQRLNDYIARGGVDARKEKVPA